MVTLQLAIDARPARRGAREQIVLVLRRDMEQQMVEGRLGRLTAQRFGLSNQPIAGR